MKLSEAIRLGAMGTASTGRTDMMFHYDAHGAVCAACVLGTAAVAAGLDVSEGNELYSLALSGIGDLCNAFPILKTDAVSVVEISDRFERYGWTRERIADWIQTIEDGLSPSTGEAAEGRDSSVSLVETA